jgi:hypothetical protein
MAKSVNFMCNMARSNVAVANERGNQVYRMYYDSERYVVDFADEFHNEGWLQFDTDQDAAYFGVWVNPKERCTLTYAEGDWTVVDCPTIESYNAEIRDMIRFYGEGFILKAFDTTTGEMETVVQDRSEFLIPAQEVST